MKPELLEEIEQGQALRGSDVAAAMLRHGQLMEHACGASSTATTCSCAVNQVRRSTRRSPGLSRWRASRWSTTWRGCARGLDQHHVRTRAVGAGRLHAGGDVPVGIQIIGRFRDDWTVLQVGYAFEQATRVGERRPPLALVVARAGFQPARPWAA